MYEPKKPGAVGEIEWWGYACKMQALWGWKWKSGVMLAKCRRCGVNGDHAVGAIRGVFYPCPHAHYCPLPATGSGRKRGTQPPTPVFVHLSGGSPLGCYSQAPCYRDRSGFFFLVVAGLVVSVSVPVSLVSLSLSLCVRLPLCLSVSLSAPCLRPSSCLPPFFGRMVFFPYDRAAAPSGTMRLVWYEVFFSVSPRPPLPPPGTGSGRKRNGGDMLAKCRHGLDYGWYACKMQALWGILEDMLAQMQVLWSDMMILIEGSLDGMGGKGFWDFACSCVPACVLLLSHFDVCDVLMFDTPLAIG